MVYKYLKHLIVLAFLGVFFTACSVKNPSIYALKNETLVLGRQETPLFVKMKNINFKTFYTGCANYSYTLTQKNKEYGPLFVEYISLDSFCRWNGLAGGFFEYNFKSKLKLDDVKTVESIDIDGYSFRTFKVGDEYYSIINIYSGFDERFIVDYEGKLYDKLLKIFKKDYVNKYLNKKRFYKYYDDSLVRKNIINHYFTPERIQMGD